MKLPPKEVTPKKIPSGRPTKPARVSLENDRKQQQANNKPSIQDAMGSMSQLKINSSKGKTPARVSLDKDPEQKQKKQPKQQVQKRQPNKELTSASPLKRNSEDTKKPARVSLDNNLNQRARRIDPMLAQRLKNCYFLNGMIRELTLELRRKERIFIKMLRSLKDGESEESLQQESDEFGFLSDIESECEVATKLYGSLRFQCHRDGPKFSDPSAFEAQIKKMYDMEFLVHNFDDKDVWVGRYEDPGYNLHLLPGYPKIPDVTDKSLLCPILKSKIKLLI
ncbi:hypothetical protein ACHAXS_011650 [Conticribra weissflogii]